MQPADRRRERIKSAAVELLTDGGQASATTAAIARHARVSKRDLYALYGSKQSIIEACVGDFTERMREPLRTAAPGTVADLRRLLVAFGKRVLELGTRSNVTALYRAAVGSAPSAVELSQSLERAGRNRNREALAVAIERASRAGLVNAPDPPDAAALFLALLWGDLQVRLLLGTAEPPGSEEIHDRADRAAARTVALLGKGEQP